MLIQNLGLYLNFNEENIYVISIIDIYKKKFYLITYNTEFCNSMLQNFIF